jgi:threonine dehydrogenase-like Zn-dependent dehydrogenase
LTTIEAAFNRLDQPMPLGYSSAGTIVALGEGLQGYQVGQRVACAGGGYAVHAEYNVVPQNLLAALPDGVDFESAAFTTLGAIAMHGFRLAEAQIGERVAIIGLGLLGLLSAAIAMAAGCRVLGIDLEPQRVDLARQMGAEAVVRDQAEEAAGRSQGNSGCSAHLRRCLGRSCGAGGLIMRPRHGVAIGAVGLISTENLL